MADDKMIKKANIYEILNHWLLTVSFFTLTVSGFGFLFQIEWIGSLFGGFNRMMDIHNWGGVVFVISLFLTMFNYLPVALRFSPEDRGWLLTGGGYFSRNAEIPPQDALNMGQKLFYLIFLAAGGAISASGAIIWYKTDIKSLMLLSHLIHNLAFDLLVIMIPLHTYLSTMANPGVFRIMVDGNISLEWAKKHHGKWVKKMGVE